ncbi:cold shock domain-containing protein [Nocardia sp. NPDC051570]|uniref:cold shock domain-containing protein n=1 Tax=Nocardia sp. NPDC051570 TaxID=3364324 RepID=UPI00379EC21D
MEHPAPQGNPTQPAFKGTVVSFHRTRGYGFILPAHGGRNVFVHYTQIVDGRRDGRGYAYVDDGDSVEFDIGTGPSGRRQAENVRIRRDAGEQ